MLEHMTQKATISAKPKCEREKNLSMKKKVILLVIALKNCHISRFGMFSLFNSMSNFVSYLIPKLRDKKVHAFPQSISSEVNIIVQLEFKLAYYNVEVQHISHYAMRTPLILMFV